MRLHGKPVDVWQRLREIDRFFAKASPVHHTMRRLVERLDTAGIPYAVMGGMAVEGHRGERTTKAHGLHSWLIECLEEMRREDEYAEREDPE